MKDLTTQEELDRIMDLDDAPRAPSLLKQIATEDLASLSFHELEERIAILEQEINRTKSTISDKKSGLSLAESAFKS